MYDNDNFSKKSILNMLNISILNKFNSMNVQNILPRID